MGKVPRYPLITCPKKEESELLGAPNGRLFRRTDFSLTYRQGTLYHVSIDDFLLVNDPTDNLRGAQKVHHNDQLLAH